MLNYQEVKKIYDEAIKRQSGNTGIVKAANSALTGKERKEIMESYINITKSATKLAKMHNRSRSTIDRVIRSFSS